MINRTMVRTRVMQALFAYYKDGEKTPLTAKKELLSSFSDTYSLYMLLLDFVNELTSYAEDQLTDATARSKVTHTQISINRHFINNQLAKQIFQCSELRNYLDNNHLSWNAGMTAVSSVYKALIESPFYKEYLNTEQTKYEDDKHIWKKIFTDLLPNNPAIYSALEEMEIVLDHANWTTDFEIICSFCVKTFKRFKETDTQLPLLQMFDTEEELNFGKDLLSYAIENHETYQQLIASHLKNWDADRIAYMDKIILQMALAEILNFPTIALEISLNEYIEMAKEYSGEKSHIFINGILNEILHDLKRDNQLMKAIKNN